MRGPGRSPGVPGFMLAGCWFSWGSVLRAAFLGGLPPSGGPGARRRTIGCLWAGNRWGGLLGPALGASGGRVAAEPAPRHLWTSEHLTATGAGQSASPPNGRTHCEATAGPLCGRQVRAWAWGDRAGLVTWVSPEDSGASSKAPRGLQGERRTESAPRQACGSHALLLHPISSICRLRPKGNTTCSGAPRPPPRPVTRAGWVDPGR